MAGERLKKDLIRKPELWNLAMKFERDAVQVVLYSPLEENSLIYRELALDPDAASYVASVEDAVYDNPLLLSDFQRVSCVVDSPVFMAVPKDVEDLNDREDMLLATFPGFDGEIYENDLSSRDAVMMVGLEKELSGFLARTFFNCRVYHHLTPLCRYFLAESRRGNTRRMYANLRGDSLDVLAFDHGKLLVANTFEYREPTDAIYYILATFTSLGLDRMADELLLSGDAGVREKITPDLRNYVSYVMPVIFPSTMFRAGRDAMQAPFDLIILPLCE